MCRGHGQRGLLRGREVGRESSRESLERKLSGFLGDGPPTFLIKKKKSQPRLHTRVDGGTAEQARAGGEGVVRSQSVEMYQE